MTLPLRIAVVGSGIAGLSAAWLLSEKHDVTIYECAATLGMDAHGVDVALDAERSVRVDVPLRVFTETYYPNLTALYKAVGVKYQPENYSGSFCVEGASTHFAYRNYLLGSLSVPYVLRCNPFNLTFLRIVRDLVWFLAKIPFHFRRPEFQRVTLRQYLAQEGYSEAFVRKMLVPTLSGICTCSYEAVEAYPAGVIIDYLATRSMKGVRRAFGGAKDVVDKLASRCKQVLTGTKVTSIASRGGVVLVSDASGRVAEYDHVVVCTQANQVAKVLQPESTECARDVLRAMSSVKYETSRLVLHDDAGLMPRLRREWRSVNFVLSADGSQSMASIWMNQVQPNLRGERDLIQTWNPLRTPAPRHLLYEATFERPVVTLDSEANLAKLHELQGRGGVWFCGSYVRMGVPLLETAVTSAVFVAEKLGCECPWRAAAPQLSKPLRRPLVLLLQPWLLVLLLFGACAVAAVTF
jgi:predicted NAD/FAD-binding protein